MSLHGAISAEIPVAIARSVGVTLTLSFALALTLSLLMPAAVVLVCVRMLTIMTVAPVKSSIVVNKWGMGFSWGV